MVSEFIKKSVGMEVETIETGTELVLIGECNKYLNKRGYNLTLDVEVDERLFNSLSKKRMIAQGVTWGTEKFETYSTEVFFNDSVESVVLKRKDDTEWVYDFQSNPTANRIMKYNAQQANLSLFAYLLVSNYLNDTNAILTFEDSTCLTPREYTQLYVLIYYGNRWGVDIIKGVSSREADWFAYVEMNRQYGYMCRPYSANEKSDFASEFFRVGDVVLLYERSKGKEQDDRVRTLEGCAVAIIEQMTSSSITLKEIHNVETILTTTNRLNRAKSEGGIVSYEDYVKFYTPVHSYSWNDIGVEYFVYEENIFISSLKAGDISYQVLMMPDGIQEIALDPFDTVYAVLENRGIEYNKDRFLERYFPNSVPLYERYRDIQPVKYERGSKKQIEDKYLGKK